jgi:hypothetical protein
LQFLGRKFWNKKKVNESLLLTLEILVMKWMDEKKDEWMNE